MTEKPKGKRRIRGAVGEKGMTLFIPFYVDLDKVKRLIDAEKEAYLKARIAQKFKDFTDALDNPSDE